MKYPYDSSFKKIAIKVPFSGTLCKLAHSAQDKMLDKVKLPDGINIKEIIIKGHQKLPFAVKVISPSNPTNVCMLDIHGGGFGFKAAKYHLLYACLYALELNCTVYFPDYHLVPEYKAPAALDDCLALYEYISKLTNQIIVLGDSAGGALAANVCNTVVGYGLVMPICQMLIYPVIDNEMTTDSMKRFVDTPLWNSKNNKKMWNLYLEDCNEEVKDRVIPMKNALPEVLPYTYIETAEFDCLHDEAVMYAKKLEGKEVKIELYETKGTIHGYDQAMESTITKESLKKRIDTMKRCLDKWEG